MMTTMNSFLSLAWSDYRKNKILDRWTSSKRKQLKYCRQYSTWVVEQSYARNAIRKLTLSLNYWKKKTQNLYTFKSFMIGSGTLFTHVNNFEQFFGFCACKSYLDNLTTVHLKDLCRVRMWARNPWPGGHFMGRLVVEFVF